MKGVMTSKDNLEFDLLQTFSIQLTTSSHFDIVFSLCFFFSYQLLT